MANKYLYWNSESNSGTTFNYSRKISTSERTSLIPGKTVIFGITYQSTSGTLYPALTISSLKLCSTAAITATEIPRSESLETVNGKQIVTKYFSAIVPELVGGNSSLTFSLSFNSSATILDCALFQGAALSMKNVHEVDKFSQFMKYDGGWKIRTGTGENDFIELTTSTSLNQHSKSDADVHGVEGYVVGTNNDQTLTHKTIKNATFNQETTNLSGTMFLKTYPTNANELTDRQVFTAKAVGAKINEIVADGTVVGHNQRIGKDDDSGATEDLHGLGKDEGVVVGTDKEQTLKFKTLNDPMLSGGHLKVPTESFGNLSGSTWDFTKINQPITANSEGTGFITTNKHVYDAIKSHSDNDSGVHDVTGSVVGTNNTQTLTNKTLTEPTINLPRITIGEQASGNKKSYITFNRSCPTITNVDSPSYLHGIDMNTATTHPTTYSELATGNTVVPGSKTLRDVLKDLFTPCYYNVSGGGTTQGDIVVGGVIIKRSSITSGREKYKSISLLSSGSFTNKYYNDTTSGTLDSDSLILILNKTGIYNIIFTVTAEVTSNDSNFFSSYYNKISLGYKLGNDFHLSDSDSYSYIGMAGMDIDSVPGAIGSNHNYITATTHLSYYINLDNISDTHNTFYSGNVCKYIGFRIGYIIGNPSCKDFKYNISISNNAFIG